MRNWKYFGDLLINWKKYFMRVIANGQSELNIVGEIVVELSGPQGSQLRQLL